MSFASDKKETPTNSEKEADVATACQSKPRGPPSAIRLIKNDFGLFKQDLLNIFKDKDAKNSEPKDKTPLNVLKGDLGLFKNEITSFTDDITGILRKGLFREDSFRIKAQEQNEPQRQEAEKEDSFKIKANEQTQQGSEAEKEDSFNIKVNGQTQQGVEGEKKNSFTIKAQNDEGEREKEEQSGSNDKEESFKIKEQNERSGGAEVEDSFRIKGIEQMETSSDFEQEDSFKLKAHRVRGNDKDDWAFKLKAQDGTRDTEKEENRDELWMDGWEVVEFEQNENMADPKRKGPDGDGGGGGPKMAAADPLISLSSGLSLLPLRHIAPEQRGPLMDDVWSIKNFAQYLTFDPNTANSELVLSDGNRTARREWSGGHMTHQLTDHVTPDHPERFEYCPQLLCREGLLDAVYWEVRWAGGVDVGVAYNSLSRGGSVSEGLLGQNGTSWSLECSRGSYTPCHRGRRYKSVSPEPFSQTVGLFLDFEAGSLSFFCVSPGSMQHLHTFTASFTEPLYPGFWLWSWGGSVTLSQVELGWERLLQ